jgi:parallel beta-helix repeat protein
MVVGGPVAAQTTLHVDDDGGQWPGAYTTITAALAAAGDGDTIIVHEGTYVENLLVSVSVTIQAAAGEAMPVIDGSANAASGWAGSVIRIAANGVTIDGFEIKNGANGIAGGDVSGATIKNNIIHANLNYVGSNGVGILLWGDNDNNVIENNIIYDNDRQGIFIGYSDTTKISTGNTISGNKIHENGLYTLPNGPDASAYGIQLWNADGNTISSNKIYHHDDWFAAPGFDFAQGIYLHNSVSNIVRNNDLHHNNYGVGIWCPTRGAGTNTINYNNIFQNTGFGVRSFDSVPLDATNNWWGHRSGPTHSGNPGGRGDVVSDNVDYDPWEKKPVTPRS